MVFISNDNLTIHEVFGGVSLFTIDINTSQFFDIRLHNLGPSLTIIKMDTIHSRLICEHKDLVNKQIPCLNFPVIEHGSIFILPLLTVSSVANSPSTLFI